MFLIENLPKKRIRKIQGPTREWFLGCVISRKTRETISRNLGTTLFGPYRTLEMNIAFKTDERKYFNQIIHINLRVQQDDDVLGRDGPMDIPGPAANIVQVRSLLFCVPPGGET